MTGNEIRETFLKYFERHGHTRVRSSPLLPANDPTLLFTNAGMNQFKDVFLGVEKRDYVRACSSQKCVRAGGKHNDLDEVGKTARHQTFFEMLGNFSFGDYFKEDAIKFAWGFLVDELNMDPRRLWFSVFGGDDEVGPDEDAAGFWEQVGAPRERILRFGRKDNFWQMGETGPCGPCSEIHYYLGEHPEDPEFNRADLVNGPGDTTMEIWNLVFMQYNRVEVERGSSPTVREGLVQYKLEPLPKPSVDTGLGLERTAVILQGKYSNYDTDLLRPIVDFTAKLAERDYKPETQEGFAMRVIADHARATAFLITDGIAPGNKERNFVLRKIMRRAIYNGRQILGFNDLFFHKVTNFVVDLMCEAYPELGEQRKSIDRTVCAEERSFGTTLTFGLGKLDSDEVEQAVFTLRNSKSFSELLSVKHHLQYQTGDEERSTQEEWVPINDDETSGEGSWVTSEDGMSRTRTKIRDLSDLAFVEDEYNKKVQEMDRRQNAINEFAALLQPLARLYDTYGTPRDLIKIRLEELGTSINEDDFNDAFDIALQELQQAGTGMKRSESAKLNPIYQELVADEGPTEFTGYQETKTEGAQIEELVKIDGHQVSELRAGEEGEIILDRTPFYAESGGQVGDTGLLTTARGAVVSVLDTFAPVPGLIVHRVRVDRGVVLHYPVTGELITTVEQSMDNPAAEVITASVDVEKRDATRRNHTATHLMHAALREVLGTHVKQAGSVVAPHYLRFDFSHYQPLTKTEIEEIENLVNYHILRNEPVETNEMAVEEAMRSGAMALFGEKYGEKVRVLSIKGAEDIFSKELCGGTHVRATGDIGVFKILGDESIASGVRRIRAVTGVDALERFREDELLIDQVASGLKTSRAELPTVIGKLQDELKKSRREADDLRMKLATGALGSSSANGGDNDGARDVAGVKVLAREASGLDAAGMRQLSDTLLARIKSGVVVLGRSSEGKVSLIVRTSDDLTSRVPAGKVIKELAPIVGGKGGGKADMAEGGGAQPEKLSEALEASYAVVEKLLS